MTMWVAKDTPKSSNAKFACMRGSCTSAVHTHAHARIHRCSQIGVRINACACQGVCVFVVCAFVPVSEYIIYTYMCTRIGSWGALSWSPFETQETVRMCMSIYVGVSVCTRGKSWGTLLSLNKWIYVYCKKCCMNNALWSQKISFTRVK